MERTSLEKAVEKAKDLIPTKPIKSHIGWVYIMKFSEEEKENLDTVIQAAEELLRIMDQLEKAERRR